MHDQMITLMGNTVATLDPKEALIESAGLFGAGQTLGMSPEQTLEFVSRSQRAQRRAATGTTEAMDPIARLRQASAQLGTVPDLIPNSNRSKQKRYK